MGFGKKTLTNIYIFYILISLIIFRMLRWLADKETFGRLHREQILQNTSYHLQVACANS